MRESRSDIGNETGGMPRGQKTQEVAENRRFISGGSQLEDCHFDFAASGVMVEKEELQL